MHARLAVSLLATGFLASLAGCASGPAVVRVEVPAGASDTDFSVWGADGSAVVQLAHAGTPVEVPPGRYLITRYGSKRWVWAKDVDIRKGSVAIIRLGALRVVPPEGVNEDFSIQDLNGNWVSELDSARELVAAPAGTWRITAYLDGKMIWGDVTVRESQVSEIALGAVNVTAPEVIKSTGASVHDPASGDRLAERRSFGKPFVARTGSIRLQSSLDITVLADVVTVSPGKITEVPIGAIRWAGAAKRVKLLTKDGGAGRTHSFGSDVAIAVSPGEWKLADASSNAVLATVTVAPGSVVEAK